MNTKEQKSICYTYNAAGIKLRKTINDNDKTTDYVGNFIYENDQLKYILTDYGKIITDSVTTDTFYTRQYNLTDHPSGDGQALGNVRVTFNVKSDSTADIVQEDSYYPFGMTMNGLNYPLIPDEDTKNLYLYNGKELQEDFGLDWYDYGARFYDAQLGRWHVVDPLAEKYESWSVYQYVRNNPIIRIDPNGMDDYTINKKTGETKLVKETDDETDRVIKTYSRKSKRGEIKYKKNGEAKTAFGGIEKGILSDGINFQENDNIIEVGGEGGPTVGGVKTFTLQLSEYIGKEIKGFSYSSDASGDVTDMLLGKYKNNTYTKSYASPNELAKKYGDNYSHNNLFQQFHTHPDGKLGATQSNPELSKDVKRLQTDKPQMPNASFIILYRIAGQIKPGEYDYTHEYKPKK